MTINWLRLFLDGDYGIAVRLRMNLLTGWRTDTFIFCICLSLSSFRKDVFCPRRLTVSHLTKITRSWPSALRHCFTQRELWMFNKFIKAFFISAQRRCLHWGVCRVKKQSTFNRRIRREINCTLVAAALLRPSRRCLVDERSRTRAALERKLQVDWLLNGDKFCLKIVLPAGGCATTQHRSE